MKNNFKYLTTGSEDINWGVYINVAGTSSVKPNEVYPSLNHPSGYYFNWDEGRILNEYQINYITDGEGILENRYGTYTVKQGNLFIIFPNEWHRYRPLQKTGWEENFIGFGGEIAEKFMSHPLFSPKQPVIRTGIREEIIDSYLKIFDFTEKEQPGYQLIASGMIIKLLGYIISFEKQKGFSGKRIAKVIEEVRFLMRQNVSGEYNLEELAQQHNVGYSYFRKMFKKFTSMSPGQYHLQLKLMRAKEMLISTDKSIKEISNELGFQSIYYFSNLFKKKEGLNPTQYRKKNILENKTELPLP
ncbi:AraC family transcriptional regulator [Maribellus maritimus]|uniref:AraC family transcriptional regulator n=1 Tax=Maribellus maritimus TaxID=2870838 RepID=UPI001EEAC341|nr:AraC family transcriptional regulator [Maribellus maritimus]MCG6190556.1 AraC family transcriptional regulator [Maribellus maritimus]